MTPDCCKKCQHLKGDKCMKAYKRCAAWRRWFHEQWEGARAVALKAKAKKEGDT